VNKHPGQLWRVAESEHCVSRGWLWWKQYHRYYRYQLLSWVAGPEWQLINFYREDGDINTWVPAELVVNFLYGVLAGASEAKREKAKPSSD